MFWADSARTYVDALKYSPYFVIYALPIGMMVQTSSIYIVVAAAVDCFVKVIRRPFN